MMTPEQEREYLETLRKHDGAGLAGIEATTYRKAKEAEDAERTAREELQKALAATRRIERAIQQLNGRAQACFELLLDAERGRRTEGQDETAT